MTLHNARQELRGASPESRRNLPFSEIGLIHRSNSSPPLSPPSSDKPLNRHGYSLRRISRIYSKDIHKAVATCGFTSGATVKCTDEGISKIHNVNHCHSAWACPVCSPKLAVKRFEILRPQIQNLMDAGWTCHLVTLTCQHDRATILSDVFEAQSIAWGLVTKGKAWQKWRKTANNSVQYIRGLDITHSEINGWHPHIHAAFYLPPDHDGDVEWLVKRWIAALASIGWRASRAAQHISGKINHKNDCLAAARYAVATAWLPHNEAIGASLKQTKKRQISGDNSMSPFEILQEATEGNRRKERLWKEYVGGTKGRRQVTTSRGFRLSADEEIDIENVEDIAFIGADTMKAIDRADMYPKLLDIINRIAPADMKRRRISRFLSEFGLSDWRIIYPPRSPGEIVLWGAVVSSQPRRTPIPGRIPTIAVRHPQSPFLGSRGWHR